MLSPGVSQSAHFPSFYASLSPSAEPPASLTQTAAIVTCLFIYIFLSTSPLALWFIFQTVERVGLETQVQSRDAAAAQGPSGLPVAWT